MLQTNYLCQGKSFWLNENRWTCIITKAFEICANIIATIKGFCPRRAQHASIFVIRSCSNVLLRDWICNPSEKINQGSSLHFIALVRLSSRLDWPVERGTWETLGNGWLVWENEPKSLKRLWPTIARATIPPKALAFQPSRAWLRSHYGYNQ